MPKTEDSGFKCFVSDVIRPCLSVFEELVPSINVIDFDMITKVLFLGLIRCKTRIIVLFLVELLG